MSDCPTPDTILQEALDLAEPEERAAYLDRACGSNLALRDEIESLLAAHFDADAFMNTLAVPVWQETASEKEGDRIGRYKLLQQIGEGGFGTVYLAEQTEPVKRRVALKVIKAGMDSKEVIARFEAERQALALMDHPHIAKVHDAGTTEGGRPYFVMELVKGVPFTKYCTDKDLDTKARLSLFMDVCAAVQHAHQKGIIHRDLKPSNILVSPHDGKPVVKVIDFGIAKAISMELTEKTVFTQLGRMIGTPQYMSPEQAELNALDVDTRSDIYSLGVVLYELLTGTTPLDGEQLRSAAYGEMQRLIREETPVKPSTRVSRSIPQGSTHHAPDSRALRGDLDWIVMKALEKERERRYETANALAQDVARHLRNEPVAAGPPSAVYRMRKFVRRNRRGLLSGALAGAALLAGLAVAAGIWLDASVEKGNRLARASELIGQAESHWEKNITGKYDDDDHFRQARGLVRQVGELLTGIDDSGKWVHQRQAKLAAAIKSEERDRRFVTEIQEALMKSVSLSGGGNMRIEDVARAFQEIGMDPLGQPTEETVSGIMQRREALRDWMLIGLVRWAESLGKSEEENATRLKAVIRKCDLDPWRSRLLGAIEKPDSAVIAELAEAPELIEQPTMTVLWLSGALVDPDLPDASEKMLRRAQRAAPADFWTNYFLGMNLAMAGAEVTISDDGMKMIGIGTNMDLGSTPGTDPQLKAMVPAMADAIGFLRAATAARPDAGTPWLTLGILVSSVGHGSDAIACFEQALASDPEDTSIFAFLGMGLLTEERYEEALKIGMRAVESNPNEPHCHSIVIGALARLDRDEEANAVCQRVIELGLDGADAYAALGSIQMMRGDTEKALASFRLGIQASPEMAELHGAIGMALWLRGEYAASLASCDEAIRLSPDLASAHNCRGLAFMQRGDRKGLAEATASFRRAIELDPTNAQTLSNLGMALIQTGNYEAALIPLKEAVAISPAFAMAWVNLGVGYNNLDRKEDAIAAYRTAIAADPNYAMAYSNLSSMLLNLGRHQEAIEACEGSNDTAAHISLGVNLQKSGMLGEAIKAYERAVELKPDDQAAISTLVLAYLKADRGEEAIPALGKVLAALQREVEKEYPDRVVTFADLADLYQSKGLPSEAATLRKTLLSMTRKEHGEEAPETLEAMTELAIKYGRTGRREEAIEMQEKALNVMRRVHPENHGLLLPAVENLLELYGREGHEKDTPMLYQEALKLSRAVRGEEDEQTLGNMTNLAINYYHMNRLDDAIALEEKALELKRRLLPKNHPFLGNAMGLLADFYHEKGRINEAMDLYEELLILRRREFGPAHSDTLAALNNLLEADFDEGRRLECARIISEHLEHLRRVVDNPEAEPQLTLRQRLADLATEQSEKLVEPKALDRYYEENQESFRETSVHLHMITILREEGKEARAAQLKTVEAWRDKIMSGTPFAEIATLHSADPYKDEGGDRGTVKRGKTKFDEDLEKAIFALEPGTISIHKNDKLLWILKVEDRREGELVPVDEVQKEIVEILAKTLREKLLTDWIEEGRKTVAEGKQKPGDEIPENQ